MIRWETAVSGSSDQQCYSQTLNYPVWTPPISAPASQAPDRLHSSLLAYFCHVRVHIILSWPHFLTRPKTPCLFRMNIPLPWSVAAMRKSPALWICCLFMLCGKRGGGCWGAHFNEFTAVLPGPELKSVWSEFVLPEWWEGKQLHEPPVPPFCAHQTLGVGHRLPVPTGHWISHLWRGTQLSENLGRVLLCIPIFIFLILNPP